MGFTLWGLQEMAVPDCALAEQLLCHGASLNELFEGSIISQYTNHYIHITKYSEIPLDLGMQEHLLVWQQLFKLMLHHVADPFASCLEEIYAWARSLELSDGHLCNYNIKTVENHSSCVVSPYAPKQDLGHSDAYRNPENPWSR